MNESWVGEKRTRSSHSRSPIGAQQQQKLEDVPELIHLIQSRMEPKTAACTSMLSKAWLHAWSTIPTLRFSHWVRETNAIKLVDIDRTLKRYLRDNIPILSFDLAIHIADQESASLAENWFRLLATKTCVKELSLAFFLTYANFNLPYEILSSENITKISVRSSRGNTSCLMKTSDHHHHPVIINCVSLRELSLNSVQISQEILDAILSSCRLLSKIELSHCSRYLNTIKVINLPCLYELIIDTYKANPDYSTDLVISHVPNLRSFSCNLRPTKLARPFNNTDSISLGTSVTQLTLGGLIITDNTSLDMIKSGFPFLRSLTLLMKSWTLRSFHFTSASIEGLSLQLCHNSSLINVQVHAPKLRFFQFGGDKLPSLSFPVSTLELIYFWLDINMPLDASFFLKMREALTVSRKYDIHITTRNYSNMLDIDIDDLRTRLPFPPAKNVEQFSFKTTGDEGMWERSRFFDAFFEICHPKEVFAMPDLSFKHNNHFCRLMLKEVLEKKETTGRTANWPLHLEHVQIKQPSPSHDEWKTLTNSERSFLDGSARDVYLDFKLKWR